MTATLTGISLCSGIESATLAAPWVDWLAYSEIEPFPSAVLAEQLPHTPNVGDMLGFEWSIYAGLVDLIVAGTPCQAFSVAGLRKGLSDERGQLTLRFAEIVRDLDPAFTVWENVPNVLRSRDNAFGCLLAGLVGAEEPLSAPQPGGWDRAGVVAGPEAVVAWRVLDAQYFGVPQRRRRVFVVRCSRRSGFDPCAVLFERHRGVRHPSPSGKLRQTPAGPTAPGASSDSGPGGVRTAVVSAEGSTSLPNLTASNIGRQCNTQASLVLAFSCKGDGADAAPVAPTLRAMAHDGGNANGGGQVSVFTPYSELGNRGAVTAIPTEVASGLQSSPLSKRGGNGVHVVQPAVFKPSHYTRGKDGAPSQLAPPLTADADKGDQDPLVLDSTVRRLTPEECERLQGMPTGWTAVRFRGKPAADSPRFRAIGNSKAVPVVAWILDRIRHQVAQGVAP
jgi:DNA (cytosine-5)-methyltransferase 1